MRRTAKILSVVSLTAVALFSAALVARADTISSVSSNFNATSVASGSYVWFTAVGKLAGSAPGTPFSVDITNSKVTFTSKDSSHTNIVVDAPNAVITFEPSGTTASDSFSGGTWDVTAAYNASGNVLLDAVAFLIPSGIQIAQANPVTWTADFSTNTKTSFTLNWAWAAAAYSSSCTDMNSSSTYGALGVKAADNSVHAGTPATCSTITSYLEPGARGGGGSNWTGSLSGTVAVKPTPTPEPGTLALLAAALLGVVGLGHRRIAGNA